jgi:hypothetical protein
MSVAGSCATSILYTLTQNRFARSKRETLKCFLLFIYHAVGQNKNCIVLSIQTILLLTPWGLSLSDAFHDQKPSTVRWTQN